MELRHLRYFVAVADELHFGRAARLLGIAQPPLSQQIQQLERELGVELFVRARRRVTLTEAGRVFLAEARAILQRTAAAATAARRAARGETGSLSVGVVASATYGLIPRVFRTFRDRHPDVALTLAILNGALQVAALRAGRIQLGIARPPFGDETLLAETLDEEPVLVALPEDHRLAGAKALRLKALAPEPFVLFPRERPGWYDFVQGLCREAGFQPAVAQEAPDLATAMALVAAGTGLTLIPASVHDLRRSGVAYRPLVAAGARTTLVALRRPDDGLPVVDRFLAVAKEVLTDERARRATRAARGRARGTGGRSRSR
jgi:DNA-binding transcriptional LysR family regulator